MDEFPPNTKMSKPAQPDEKPEVTKIVTGEVIKRKKPLGTKFREIFGGNFRSAGGYIMAELVMPTIRGLIVDSISKGTERVVMGETRRELRRSNPGYSPRVSYNSPINRDPRQLEGYSRRGTIGGERPNVGEVILAQRDEAQLVMEAMVDIVDKFRFVTVGDLYDLLGFNSTFVDNSWGWSNLSAASIKQVREGYLLELPDPEPK
jgi:hypothetical protein